MQAIGDQAEDVGDSVHKAGDEAEEATDKMASGFSAGTKAITAMTAAVTGAVAGIGKLTSNAMTYAKEVDNAAEQSGIAAERIQEIAGVAERVSGASFDSVRDGLKELALRSAEAAEGAGEAQEAFQRLGISQSALQNLGTAELFSRVQKEMKGLTQQQRILTAEQVFGGEAGEKFAEVMGLSADRMAELRQEVRETGAVMSAEQIEKLEELREEWSELTSITSGLGRKIASDLLPVTKDLLTVIKDLTSWMSELDSATRKTLFFGGGAALALGPVVSGLQKVKGLVTTITGVVSASTGGFGALFASGAAGGFGLASLMDTTSAAGKLSDRTQQLKQKFSELNEELQDVEGSSVPEMLTEIQTQHQRISGTVGAVTAKIQQRESRLEQLRKLRKEVSGAAQQGIQQTIERKETELGQLRQELVVLKELMDRLSRLRTEWKDVGTEIDTAGTKAQEAAEKMRTVAQEASPVQPAGQEQLPTGSPAQNVPGQIQGFGVDPTQIGKRLDKVWQRISSRMTTTKKVGVQALSQIGNAMGRVIGQAFTFDSAISSIGDAFTSLWDMIKGILQRMISRLASAAAIAGIFGPLLGISNASFGKIFGSVLGGEGIPGLDTGGFVMETGVAKVHKGEAVVPKSKLNDMMSAPRGRSRGGHLSASISMDELIFQLDRGLRSRGQPGLLTS